MKVARRAAVNPKGRFIAGRFGAPSSVDGRLEARSPFEPDDLIAVFPFSHDDVADAVEAARRASPGWRALSPSSRISIVGRLLQHLKTRLPDLSLLLQREQGRPPWECQRETNGLLARLEHTLTMARGADEPQDYDELDGRVVSHPLGVVAVLGPAMLPLSTSHTHIVAALVTGNCVVWKPSPLCPASAQLYTEAFESAGLPPGVFNMVPGDDAVGVRLAAEPGLDGLVFTGSTENGRELARRLDGHGRVKLMRHLGAKNAALIMENADLKLAAYEVATSAFMSAGQRCTALSRVLVHEAVLEPFVQALFRVTRGLKIGVPNAASFMGPMLSEERMERLLAWRARAVVDGAEPILPGDRLDRPGWFVSPSIHLASTESDYLDTELFGPDLAVQAIASYDDGVNQCEHSRFGLAAALFCKDGKRWRAFTEQVHAGSLFWNRGTTSPSGRLPFTGFKDSGDGSPGGAQAIQAMRRDTAVLWGHGHRFPGTPEELAPPLPEPEADNDNDDQDRP